MYSINCKIYVSIEEMIEYAHLCCKDKNKRIKDMAKLVKDVYTYEIKAVYKLGGYNYFNGDKEPRGYRIHFSKCIETIDENGNRWTETNPLDKDSLMFFVKEAKKFSQKQEDRINKWIEDNQEELFRLYFEDRDSIASVIFYHTNRDFKYNIQ